MKDSDEKHTAGSYLGRILAGAARPFFYRSGVRALLGVPDNLICERGVPCAAARIVNMYPVRRPHGGKLTGYAVRDVLLEDRKPEHVNEPAENVESESCDFHIVRTTDIQLPEIQKEPYSFTPRFDLLSETMKFAENVTTEAPDTGVVRENHAGHWEPPAHFKVPQYAVEQPVDFSSGGTCPERKLDLGNGRACHSEANTSAACMRDILHSMQPVPDSPYRRIERVGFSSCEGDRRGIIPKPPPHGIVSLDRETVPIQGIERFHHSPAETENEAAVPHDGRNEVLVRKELVQHFFNRPSITGMRAPRSAARPAFWQRRYVRRMHLRMFR